MATNKVVFNICGMLFLSALAGCASVDQNLSLHKKGDFIAKKEQRVIYLAIANDALKDLSRVIKPEMRLSMTGKRPKVRANGGASANLEDVAGKWVVITEKNERGQKLGVTLMPLPLDKLIMGELEKELKAKGYAVIPVNTLPTNVEKGIAISAMSVDTEQVTDLLEVEGRCTVKVCLRMWLKGSRVKQLNYEAGLSDASLFNKKGLAIKMVHATLHTLIIKALPDIVKELGSKT